MNANGNPNTDSADDFEDVVSRHFDGGCSDCVTSRDAYWHELEIGNRSVIELLELEVKEYELAVTYHRNALQRLTNPIAVANAAQALEDTRVKLADAQARLARRRS
ncbi:hypothetical protein BIU97_01825 [Curtobacterium sp. MCBA15_009]|uniref:hypothetical protein n=1 Tax=Curtobacterium sp. MCBA15_009 TaxID=1898737 RepID=UPI0008DCCCF4|nr:hypothetical protein [Curtobacterium sp. MCBA15_009]OII14214.1 hypothetical protein BIU97_01825 [Curtobacterium sp. MCBA15_009]